MLLRRGMVWQGLTRGDLLALRASAHWVHLQFVGYNEACAWTAEDRPCQFLILRATHPPQSSREVTSVGELTRNNLWNNLYIFSRFARLSQAVWGAQSRVFPRSSQVLASLNFGGERKRRQNMQMNIARKRCPGFKAKASCPP